MTGTTSFAPAASSESTERREPALVFHIQRGSLHDGPGIRTVVFLKGCPLRCHWCFNPEGMLFQAELRFCKDICLGTSVCGRCLDGCPDGAIQKTVPSFGDGIVIQRQACRMCGVCSKLCPSGALSEAGSLMTPESILAVAEKDNDFYRFSGGGITLSGGEPLARPAFAAELLRKARARNLHTTPATSGWYDRDNPHVRECLRHTELILFDIKHMDSRTHRQHTSVDNSRILENFRCLGREFPHIPIIARTPVVPGLNDTPKAIKEIALFAASIPSVCDHELLPYEAVGRNKYSQLGLAQHALGRSPDSSRISELTDIVDTVRI